MRSYLPETDGEPRGTASSDRDLGRPQSWIISLFRATLRACVRPEQEARYRALRDSLVAEVRRRLPPRASPLTKGEAIFTLLWETKPRRYQSGGPFRLSQVLENQLDLQQEHVGNCLGLTLLYNCLAARLGLKAGALHLDDAFGQGPHVLSLLYLPQRAGSPTDETLDVENSLPQGFGFLGHSGAPGREVWGDKELVADLWHSLGNEAFEAGDFPQAAARYRRALALNPRYETARLNLIQAVGAMDP